MALETSVVIEQAKGILAERLAVSIDEAFVLLRRAASSNRSRIHELAARVVSSESTPAEVEAERRRLSR
jgi:AmiR/NasT family two-component response regulator